MSIPFRSEDVLRYVEMHSGVFSLTDLNYIIVLYCVASFAFHWGLLKSLEL